MEKLKMHSPNFAQENIAKLAALFPNCVTEEKDADGNLKRSIDFDLLRQELSGTIVEGPQERYHLNWPGKREALLAANSPIAKTFRPCRDESEDFDTTGNLFIEGDNLDALKLLQETYLGKVKMIYIDPPYNTGKDFIYSDNFAESAEEYLLDSGQKDKEGNRLIANTDSNGRFHSDWISMMYSRLKLARNLLKDDGVIFISIDDGEVHNLRKICDEIFGERNFVIDFIWRKRDGAPNDRTVGFVHEHIITYGKSGSTSSNKTLAEECFNLMPRTEKANSQYKVYTETTGPDPRGPFRKIDTTANGKGGRFVQSLYYPVRNPNTGEDVYPREGTCWRHSKEDMAKLQTDNRLYWGVKGTATTPMRKLFLSESKPGMTTPSILPDMPFNQHAAREVEVLLERKAVFETPKPSELLKLFIHIGTTKNDICLDFFAGAGATAHAVMQLNGNDGGNRKFIMVQLPETCDEKSEAFKAGYKTIAEISKERIRRAGKKIKDENSTTSPTLDTGFRVLKVDSSNMADVYYTPDKITQGQLSLFTENIKDDRSTEDLLFQVLLDWGVDLTLPITKETVAEREVFFVDDNALAACFVEDGRITEEFCKELAKREPLRVVFRDSGFKDDSVKINVEQIFKLMSPDTEVKCI